MGTSPLESPGRSLAERQVLEEKYSRLVEPRVSGFVRSLRARAVQEPVSQADAMSLWMLSVGDLESRLPSDVYAWVRDSSVPLEAFAAVTLAQGKGAELAGGGDLSKKLLFGLLGVALGLAVSSKLKDLFDSPAKGTLTTETGHTSWKAYSAGIARSAATLTHSREFLEEMRAEGYTHKRWTTRYDNRVRPSHVAADRQTVLLDETFMVGGDQLRYPADPNGSPDEVMGCRCALIAVRFGDRPYDFPAGVEPWNNPRP